MSIFSEETRRDAIDTLKAIFGDINEEDFYNKNSYCFLEELENTHRTLLTEYGIMLAEGATRNCLVSNDEWVIKFNKPDNSIYDPDYCDKEAKFYKEAVEKKIDRFFTPVDFLIEYKGIKFYIAQKVETYEGIADSRMFSYAESYMSKEEYGYINGVFDEDKYNDCIWEEAAEMNDTDRIYAMLGQDSDIDILIDFCKSHNINDLHSSNWGFINSMAKIIDYAGF